MPPLKSQAQLPKELIPTRRPRRCHTISERPLEGLEDKNNGSTGKSISPILVGEESQQTGHATLSTSTSSPQVNQVRVASSPILKRPPIRPRQFIYQSRKVVRRRSSIKSSLFSSLNSTPSSLSSSRISAEINPHHLYVRSGHVLTLPSSKTCPLLPATSPNVAPTFKKRTLKELCSSPQNLSNNNNNSLSGGNILSAILSRSTTTDTITTAPIPTTATTTPIPIATTDSSIPTSTQLEPGMMITREYVVDEEDLEAPALNGCTEEGEKGVGDASSGPSGVGGWVVDFLEKDWGGGGRL
ncbi:hypothetical protein K435DRAFT_870769 [Dendrothele bispora CBS 962.96]|uniref:Uncharacterized protein n=1 Tax=Dendrothele bispora (strain CBS 962.96) TaxID=1314807 RepID=A0A4S8L5S8_DENBC|nr:hypothetical protein K435DRAFT_870769 [Dendrothele bispora CBS 962.96]